MAQDTERSAFDRRRILKGLGAGTLALPLVMGRTTAKQESLRVDVEPGTEESGRFSPKTQISDHFKAQIDVSGRSGTYLAYMVAVFDTDDELIKPRSDAVNASWSSGSVVTTQGWNPDGVGSFGEWSDGTYHLYATVADNRGDFGSAISDPFEIVS